MAPHSSVLAWKSHGWRSLVGCSPWGHKESDTTERLHFPFSLSCIGEGNGTPLQCSCLEHPRDGGAWWAAVHGVAQGWTRLSDSAAAAAADYIATLSVFTLRGSFCISSVQSLSCVRLFATPWTAERQAFLSITNSRSLLKFTSIESVMPSSHLTLCHSLLLPPSIFPSIRVFSNESVLYIRWPKYWSFSISPSPSNIFRTYFL